MSMSDPIADMLIRIRNAQMVRHVEVVMPASKLKASIAQVLKQEGYIEDFAVRDNGVKKELAIALKYYAGRPVIERLERVSKPGLRVYKGRNDIPRVMNGLGVAILSTSRGVMTDRKARADGVGGRLGRRFLEVDGDDVRAGASQRQRRRAADAARGAGDERRLRQPTPAW